MLNLLNDLQVLIGNGDAAKEDIEISLDNDQERDMTNFFQNLINEAQNELYSGCSQFLSLNFLVKLMHIKVLNGWSNKSFDMLLELLKAKHF